MKYQTVGVIGAGVMGTGISHALAESGHDVLLVDIDDRQLARSVADTTENLRLYRLLGKRPDVDPAEVLGRIHGGTGLEVLAEADFVIENITENWGLKQDLHRRLDGILPPSAPVAINTSAIPIAKFGALYAAPDRVVGMHFMNPVPVMPMIEVIEAERTAADTLDAARALVEQLGKQCIVVNDSPGFVTNRVMMLMVNEAIFLMHEGVAGSARDVDRLFMTCFNHRMGPLRTADLIGLDTVLYSIQVLHTEFADDKYRPCPLLEKMVEDGLHGRKSGQGFYDWAPPATISSPSRDGD